MNANKISLDEKRSGGAEDLLVAAKLRKSKWSNLTLPSSFSSSFGILDYIDVRRGEGLA